MAQSLESQIRAHLASYVDSKCSLEAFEHWFVPNALSAVEDTDEPDLDQLIYEVELRLAEFSHGDHTEDELKELLQPLAQGQRART
jgi:hypothetical protein